MKAAELRRKYIEFFKKHGHVEIKSAPVIPENDPTCLLQLQVCILWFLI